MPNHVSKTSLITLGTAQLGLPYGLGLAKSGLDEQTAYAVLDAAWAAGIRAFDTARAYGTAEERIGRWLAGRSTGHPTIISKFAGLRDADPVDALRAELATSMRALGVGRIDLYLAHRHRDLLRPGVRETLQSFVDQQQISAFGASLYTEQDAAEIRAVPGLAAIQLPLNLANRTAEQAGVIDWAARTGVKIFARSVFLQGLLLSEPRQLTGYFSRAAPVLDRLQALAVELGTSRAALALAAVRSIPGVSSIVVGVDGVTQLSAIVSAMAWRAEASAIRAAFDIVSHLPADLADPRQWKHHAGSTP